MSKITDVTTTFDEFIKDGVAVVDFWAEWCGPCRMLAPILEEVAEELIEVKFGKVDVDKNKSLAEKFKIMYIPNLCVFKDGQLVDRIQGLSDADEITDTVKKYL